MKNRTAILLGASLLTLGCDSPTDVPAPRTEEPSATVIDNQINALEKARAVEGQMQHDEEKRRQQMEQAAQ
jgi:hypothetical protein